MNVYSYMLHDEGKGHKVNIWKAFSIKLGHKTAIFAIFQQRTLKCPKGPSKRPLLILAIPILEITWYRK